MIPLLLALVVSPAQAAARIAITAEAPVSVSVNRHVYPEKLATYSILCDPGRNRVQAGGSVLIIDVPSGHEAVMRYIGGKLILENTVFVEGLAETDYVDWYYDPDEDPANNPDLTGVMVNPTTAELTPDQVAALASGPGTLRLSASEPGAWYDIAVNGITLARLRNFFEATAEISLAPGEQQVEIRDATGSVVLTRGTLKVPGGETVDVRVSASGLQVVGAPDAWTPGG
ncbi:MAG: DUF4397 domain-containing protein [Alphaproteobacteria bacterium]|nr:DUF4397 domain-containing protein [Alphaproteobacteria bacterium]